MISIICPVYNSSKYLKDCIESVLNQSFSDWELILVDDGSTDNSLSICKNFSCSDKRIKTFHKENEGQWLTREYGIKHSSGNYFIFLDSDDMLEKDALMRLYRKIEDVNPDMILYDICKLLPNGNKQCLQELFEEKCITGIKDIINYCFVYNNCISLCVYCFKTSFYKQITTSTPYDKKIRGQEDFLMLFDIIQHLKELYVISKVLYIYRTNEMSVTKRLSTKDYLKNIEISDFIYKQIFEKYNNDLNDYSTKIKTRLSWQPLSFIKRAYLEMPKNELNKNFKIVRESFIYKNFTSHYRFESFRDRITLKLFKMHLHGLNKILIKDEKRKQGGAKNEN